MTLIGSRFTSPLSSLHFITFVPSPPASRLSIEQASGDTPTGNLTLPTGSAVEDGKNKSLDDGAVEPEEASVLWAAELPNGLGADSTPAPASVPEPLAMSPPSSTGPSLSGEPAASVSAKAMPLAPSVDAASPPLAEASATPGASVALNNNTSWPVACATVPLGTTISNSVPLSLESSVICQYGRLFAASLDVNTWASPPVPTPSGIVAA
mmetsp:Transcript_82993/g.231595  ORF Transcript_82993/g.231595 Transcript_82993/m.231595 type:complete len:210 (+) Transcript_82993:277-906(+)